MLMLSNANASNANAKQHNPILIFLGQKINLWYYGLTYAGNFEPSPNENHLKIIWLKHHHHGDGKHKSRSHERK